MRGFLAPLSCLLNLSCHHLTGTQFQVAVLCDVDGYMMLLPHSSLPLYTYTLVFFVKNQVPQTNRKEQKVLRTESAPVRAYMRVGTGSFLFLSLNISRFNIWGWSLGGFTLLPLLTLKVSSFPGICCNVFWPKNVGSKPYILHFKIL